jgi:hypothetical protein
VSWLFSFSTITINFLLPSILQALAGLVEVPAIGIAMYIIMKTGKKWLFSATFLACGISCFFAAIFEGNEHMLWLKITFVMVGKLIFVIFLNH